MPSISPLPACCAARCPTASSRPDSNPMRSRCSRRNAAAVTPSCRSIRGTSLPLRADLDRVDRDNAIDQYLRDDLTPAEDTFWLSSFSSSPPPRLSPEARRAWLNTLHGVTLGSDAFIPFRDNVDRAHASGVDYVVQPGGALREQDIIAACDEYGMAMVCTGLRLFHH